MASPYPLRHNGTNIHLTRRGESDADFASYLFVTQNVGLMPSPLPGGRVTGSVRLEDRELRIASARRRARHPGVGPAERASRLSTVEA